MSTENEIETPDEGEVDTASIWAEITGGEADESDAENSEESTAEDAEGSGESEADESTDEPTATDDAMEQLKDTVQKLKEQMDGKGDEKPQEKPQPAQQAQDTFIDPYDRLDKKQQELLQKFEEDYPEVKDAFQLSMGMAFERLIYHQNKEQAALVNQINKVLIPLLEMQTEYKSEREERRTRTEVPEYDKVNEWIGKQPKVVQKAYTEAMKSGGDERKEVIELFRKSTEKQSVKEKERTIKSMAPIKSRRAPEPTAGSASEENMSPDELWNKITKSSR